MAMSVTSATTAVNPWMRILDALEKKINRHSYDTWLKPTRYSHSNGGMLFVRVPTAEFRQDGGQVRRSDPGSDRQSWGWSFRMCSL